MGYWAGAFARPVEERIGVAPPELVEFLVLDTIAQQIPAHPRAPDLEPGFADEVRGAFAELPVQVRRLAAPKLAGIYFIQDIGGTGFTDQISADGSDTAAGAFIVLDPMVLRQRTANAWATWKENTPFRPAPGFGMTARIEDSAGDTRRNAIQYILLHELAHVISVGRGLHPSWNVAPRPVAPGEFPYFDQSWRFDADQKKYVSRFDADFPQRRSVVYYFGAGLEAHQMTATYDRLEQTNFATLYGATSPGDDFAEAFANYVHTVLMDRPFEIAISRDGAVVRRYRACWSEVRCAGKRAFLERLVAAAPH